MTQPSASHPTPQILFTETRLSSLIAPQFYGLHKVVKRHHQLGISEIWERGGRGSTKSSFTAIQIVLGIMLDPDAHALLLRKVSETIRNSIHANVLWAIDALGVADRFRAKVSPSEIIYRPTGQKIMMYGLDKPEKLKSIKVRKGYIKYLWFEEVPEFSGMEEIRNVAQSALRGGPDALMFLTFNPPKDPGNWVNVEVNVEKPGRAVHTSCYLSVPPAWLGDKFLRDAEHMKQTDNMKYRHEYLGEAIGNTEAIIFSGNYSVQDFTPQPHWDGPYQGADWGFSQDPATIVRCWIERIQEVGKKSKLYIEYASFSHGVELNEYPQFYDGVVDKDDPNGGIRKHKIQADNSQPATISHVKSMGYMIESAEKWPGSIEDGITVLKSFDIIIHTRCGEMQEEAAKYSYKVDRHTLKVTTIIVDAFNHGWDAVRYALAAYIKRKPKGFFDV